MRTSLAAVYGGAPGELTFQNLPTPSPQGREILTRMVGCTLCGSDLHSFSGRRAVPVPTILGHEYVGEIVAFGPAAPTRDLGGRPLQVGDRVTWSIVASCGDCFYCERDLPQKCLRAVKYGHEAFQPGKELVGGLAEHCLLVAGTDIVKLPASLPLEAGCPASCATATIVAAMEAAEEIAERTVCILGCGLLGLTACAYAKYAGAKEVFAVDTNKSRRQRALTFGASQAMRPEELSRSIRSATDGKGVDIVVELSGANTAFEGAWPLVRIGGTVVLVGAVFPAPAVPIHLEHIVRRNLTIRGVHNYAPRHLLAAVDFLTDQHEQFPFRQLVPKWYPLKDALAAFEHARQPEVIRIGVRPE